MTAATVFIVSEDAAIRDSIAELVASADLRSEIFSCLEEFSEAVATDRSGCLVLDTRIGDDADPARAAAFAGIYAQRPVLLMVDRGEVTTAVRAIREGALDILEKPCREAQLLTGIVRALALAEEKRASG